MHSWACWSLVLADFRVCDIAEDRLLGMMRGRGSEEANVTKFNDSGHLIDRNIVW